MGHNIDLKNYQIRTDLAIDLISKDNGINTTSTKDGDVTITNVLLDEKGSNLINKKKGTYITIEFKDITDYENKEKVKKIFSEQLKKLLKQLNINDNASALLVGLGNDKSTPDALGPLTINHILVTNHLFMLDSLEEGFRRVSAINPGVMGTTGIETSLLITSVIKNLKPDFVIVIDALASQSLERVNKTIQMTDTGIHPGSGVGNKRKEISFETVGIPVVAIGVPTVVDAVTIVSDTINYMHKHYTYMKSNIDSPINKLIPVTNINFLNKKIKENKNDREKLLGIVGTLNDEEVKQLIFEVLTPIGYNLMVTPKEVDFVVDKLSDIIGNGINIALHKKVDNL